jgi:hypothetical protein
MSECPKCGDPTGHEGMACHPFVYGMGPHGLSYVRFENEAAARAALDDPDFDFAAVCKPIKHMMPGTNDR